MGERMGWLERYRRWRETGKRERVARIENCPRDHGIIYIGQPRGPKCDHCGEPRERFPTASEMENW